MELNEKIIDMFKPYMEEQMTEWKKLESEPFEFVFGDTVKKVELKKIISGKMIDTAIEIIKGANLNQFLKFVDDVEKKLNRTLTVAELIDYVSMNECPYDKFQVRDYYSDKKNFKDYNEIREQKRIDIEIFKLLFDRRQFTTLEQDKLNENYDSDFWNEQDYFKIKQLVVFFRSKNGI